jgi:hypothetical protein
VPAQVLGDVRDTIARSSECFHSTGATSISTEASVSTPRERVSRRS